MSARLQLAGLVGSLRQDSFNRAVFDAAVELVADDVTLSEIGVRGVPFYDGDLEADGDLGAVEAMRSVVAEADGLIVFTPEYNRSVPAVTKNAIDWLSRLPGTSVLPSTAVGIVAATPGRHDAAGTRSHLAQSISANTDRYYEISLGIASISRKLTDGVLTDPETRTVLAGWLADFVAHVDRTAPD